MKKSRNKNYYDYYEYGKNYFYYDGVVNRNYYINGVSVEVKNDIINYVEEESLYGTDSKRTLRLIYNTYDADGLKLKFSGSKNHKVVVTTSDNESYVLEGDGTHTITSKNGTITIKVYDVTYNRGGDDPEIIEPIIIEPDYYDKKY